MSTQDRAPSFPFYAKDWLADPKVSTLSYDFKGRYIDLLAAMWEHGREGCVIPKDTAEKKVGKAFIKAVTSKPHRILEVMDMEGFPYLYSDRLFQEAQKMSSRREAAKRAALIRWDGKRSQCDS